MYNIRSFGGPPKITQKFTFQNKSTVTSCNISNAYIFVLQFLKGKAFYIYICVYVLHKYIEHE